MNQLLIITLIGIALLIHQQAHSQSKLNHRKPLTGNVWIDRFGIKRNPNTEMIGGRSARFYLHHPKVAQIAKAFYLGKFRAKDDDSTTHLVSLIATGDTLIRPFYRWCLDQVIFIADGALAEYPGEPAFRYACAHPQEFFTYMDSDKTRQRYKRWVLMMAYSGLPTYNESNDSKLHSSLVRELIRHCQPCTISLRKRISQLATELTSKNRNNN